ncbi:class I SAM-dependent DNA methyltransferase [Clostridium celatum]|uniref:Methyltransferase domain protein n=1 Tax=Clostridium celatum DSM 1785 TaxID=545697 RepID=L1QFE8_9CLOT|nr:class I SAM-dependent methyltransferase [Clostridium celatum]EKY26713.1 methyltransferase domain protein [Clostridium celatum DSM 1785]MCE9653746.1 class I SAM-dependent methyltransferase [Clostridium celatum]
MEDKTVDFYNSNSKSYVESTLDIDMSHLYSDFLSEIPSGGAILDLGCGSGRDSKVFIDKGYKITAVDGSKELAKLASRVIGQEVIVSKFEDLRLTESYDGIWACASLLHVNRSNIVDVIKNISCNLNRDGVFYMSFKYGNNEYIDDKGRYFNCYTKESFEEMIKNIPELIIRKIYKSGDTLGGRSNLEWLNVLITK